MQAILIDDQESQRKNLKDLLTLHCPDINILGEADSVQSGIALIQNTHPQLVFMDIDLGDGTGFDILESIGDPHFSLVFVTGHNEFAIKAFKYSALDYILKPVNPTDLGQALERARKMTTSDDSGLRIQNLLESRGSKKQEKIILSDADSIYLVEVSEILRCQAESNYTRFFLTEKREILVSKTLKEYEQLFEGQPFFRVHQSHLVNLTHFSRLDKKEGGTIVMKDGSFVPVAVRRKDELLSLLKSL